MSFIFTAVSPKYFALWQGGKSVNPQELTEVSDWGSQTQPTPPQREV